MSGLEIGTTTANASCSPYGSTSYVIVAAVSAGIAVLSLILLFGVIFILILFKKYQFFSQRLILYLAISSILVDIAIILHRVDYNNQTTEFYTRFCEFGGFLDELSKLMLLMSVCSITIFISLKTFFKKNTEKLELIYIIFIFAFPLTFAWIPFIWKSYGRVGAWCWIQTEEQGTCEPYLRGQVLQYLMWFGPLYVGMFFLVNLYALLLIHLYCKKNKWTREPDARKTQERKKMSQQGIKTLIIYPLLYFLLNIFPLINTTYNLVKMDSPSLFLWYLDALANPSIGTLITFAYCMDPETRKRLNLNHIRGAIMEWLWRDNLVTSYTIEGCEDGDLHRTDSYKGNSHYQLPYRKCMDMNQASPGSSFA